nr:MAG TPA: hypothetical protein [Caudoviricetes sp.]
MGALVVFYFLEVMQEIIVIHRIKQIFTTKAA